jgi:hypothetical protein
MIRSFGRVEKLTTTECNLSKTEFDPTIDNGKEHAFLRFKKRPQDVGLFG